MAAPSSAHPASDRPVSRFSSAWIGGAALAITAIVVLAFVILPSLEPGTGGDGSPVASATDSQPGASTAPPSVSPPSTPVATGTVAPTPTPTASAGATATWTGIAWSDPVTPAFNINLSTLVPWGDGYVAVGLVRGEDFGFLSSTDGLHWTVTQVVASQDEALAGLGNWRLAGDGDALYAFAPASAADTTSFDAAPPRLYRSPDGTTWSRIDSESWDAGWPAGTVLVDAVAGSAGLVAIGDARAGDHAELLANPVVLHSSDGMTWTSAALGGASPGSVLLDVVAYADGYAALGGIQQEGSTVGVGMPSAWWSRDGVSWDPAVLDGAVDQDNHFQGGTAFAASGGLVARTQSLCAGCPPDLRGWLSTDGRTWRRDAGDLPSGLMSSDGVRLVALATEAGWTPFQDDAEPYPGLTRAWISLDGASWQPMSMTHPMTDQIELFWVVPDGVIYAGAQSFWFGTPITP